MHNSFSIFKANSVFFAIVTLSLISSSSVHADVRVPAVFSDHMVLQADAKIPVWGMAAPGEDIQVSLGDRTARTKAGPDGKWRVDLEPMAASSTPRALAITGTNKLQFQDVLIGEVWLCSGQSNMYFNLAKEADASTELPKAGDPDFRFAKVADNQAALHPQDDLKCAWQISGPESAKNISAVAYYFGKQLRQKLGRPVGIIVSSVGGTAIQSWMSLDSLKKDPPFVREIAKYQDLVDNYDENKARYARQMEDYDVALKKWRDEVEPPFKAALAQWKAQDDEAKKNHQPGPPAPVAPHGPPKPMPPDGDRGTPTALFNAMIAPLLPFAFKGVAWYQGESNSIAPESRQYGEMLSRLVTDWREKAGRGDFPFLIIQLEFFHDMAKKPVDEGNGKSYVPVREGELNILALPQTALVVALDQGNAKDVHPPRKSEVGRRLSLAALNLAYHEDIVASGPLYQSMKIEGNRIRITFRPSKSALVIGPTSGMESTIPLEKLSGFAIAGAEKKWVWADARIDGDTVLVSSSEVPAPVAVRYGWADNPPVNLYNKDGLPASPFRTDNWDGQ